MKKLTNAEAMAKSLEALSAIVVKQFDELSNSTDFNSIGAGKFFLLKIHRYLQQQCVKWMFDIIDAIGHAPSNYFDGRNEWAGQICRATMKALEEQGLYYSRYKTPEDYKMSYEESDTFDYTDYKDIDKVREFFGAMSTTEEDV